MRFFRSLIPARPFEYLVLMVITYGIAYWALFIHLGLSFNIDERQVSYIERNLPLATCVIVAVLGFQWITAMRRLTNADRPTESGFYVVLPVIGILFAIRLLSMAEPKEMGSAPSGGDPLDPQAWLKHSGSNAQPGVTFQGKTVTLPGDDQRNAA